MVRVGAERNARTLFAGDFQKTDPQVLPVRVAVDLTALSSRAASARIQRSNPPSTPRDGSTRASADDRGSEYRDCAAGQVAARLILFPAQRGIGSSRAPSRAFATPSVACRLRLRVKGLFPRAKDHKVDHSLAELLSVKRQDFPLLLPAAMFIKTAGNTQALSVIRDCQ